MASNGLGFSADPEVVVRYVKDGGHLNKTLSSICQAEGLGKNGVKSELQGRIIASESCFIHFRAPSCRSLATSTMSLPLLHFKLISPPEIRSYAAQNNGPKFERLKNMIYNPNSISQASSQYGGIASSGSSPALSTSSTATPGSYLGVSNNHSNSYNGNMGGGVAFRGYPSQSKSAILFELVFFQILIMLELEFKPSPFYKIQAPIGDTQACEGEGNHTQSFGLADRS